MRAIARRQPTIFERPVAMLPHEARVRTLAGVEENLNENVSKRERGRDERGGEDT